MQPFEPKYLEFTSQPEENTNEQEHPSPINPRSQYQNKHNGIQRNTRAQIRQRHFDGGEEYDFVGELDDEGGQQYACQALEGLIELAFVSPPDGESVIFEAIEEEELPEAVLSEEGGECEEGNSG